MKNNPESNSQQLITKIESFLNMEKWNNIALKRIIDCIMVSEAGEINVIFKDIN